MDAGSVRARGRPLPADWVVPGPSARGEASGEAPEQGEELCWLTGHWRIFQRVGGHRWSTDDLVTAWWARKSWVECRGVDAPAPSRCLDLGCGIGSVLMMVAWQYPAARCTGIEAQRTSAAMARRSLRYNGADGRCVVHDGDIRDAAVLPDGTPRFDLVTGTPPHVPTVEQRAGACRDPLALNARARCAQVL